MSGIVNNINKPSILVIGVGDGGCKAINNMIESNLQGVQFIAANTDIQALANTKADTKIQLGPVITEGLGAGADPKIGRDAALESTEVLKHTLKDSKMVIIIAGLGGGTGTGASSVIAAISKAQGSLTVAVVTRPFSFEAKRRGKQAEEGIARLKEEADAVIIIPNNSLRGLDSKKCTLIDMLSRTDEILNHSVKGITDLILRPGLVNLDFADLKAIMSKAGNAIMGIGVASGENRATEAAERAISHLLLEDNSIVGARGVLINFTSNSELAIEETIEGSERIFNEIGDDDVEIIWGTSVDETLTDELRVTVIATGISDGKSHMQRSRSSFREAFRSNDLSHGLVRNKTFEEMKNSDEKKLQPPFMRKKQGARVQKMISYVSKVLTVSRFQR